MTFGYLRPGRDGRLKRLEEKVGRPAELNVGGGRTIIVSPTDRYAMFLSALGNGDHPLLDAVRSGVGGENRDELADFLYALEGGDGPPSGNPDEPWVAHGGDDLVEEHDEDPDDLDDPGESEPG